MAHALPLPPDEALGASQYGCRRPSMPAPRIKLEDNVSPKSVITDIRFVSPASSSSSSMDHRLLSDGSHVKLQQPRHDRGYSISDGESSDQDTGLESCKVKMLLCPVSGRLHILLHVTESCRFQCGLVLRYFLLERILSLVLMFRFAPSRDRWSLYRRRIL